ncbi:MAG: metallophosphoesterase [Phycisphaerae bacterium]|nr:metallophosphoesterase [Phycisphaerae bacterium]
MWIKIFFIALLAFTFAAPSSGRDLTFFVWSDTHFGAYDDADITRLKIIEQMNRLPGTEYPAEIFADATVGRPEFLLHLGDISEHGFASEWNDPNLADQRSYIQTIKHLTATDQTYEVLGNHDSRGRPGIRRRIARKQGDTFYSFDAQGVHFVVLDLYRHLNTQVPSLDEEQLDWLQSDLDRIDDTVPVIIAMHAVPPRWTAAADVPRAVCNSFDRLWNIVADKNILAFLHGHVHVARSGRWYEFDTLAPAGFAYMRRRCPQGEPVFAVVRITDDRMTVCGWDWEKERFFKALVFDKSFSPAPEDGSPCTLPGP